LPPGRGAGLRSPPAPYTHAPKNQGRAGATRCRRFLGATFASLHVPDRASRSDRAQVIPCGDGMSWSRTALACSVRAAPAAPGGTP